MVLKKLTHIYASTDECKPLLASRGETSIEGIHPSTFPFIVATAFNHAPSQIIAVTADYHAMNQFIACLSAFTEEEHIFPYPPLEVLPYELVNPSSAIGFYRVILSLLLQLLNRYSEPSLIKNFF